MSAEGTPAAGGTGTPWYDGVVPTINDNGTTKPDPAFVSYMQNRGWDKLDPKLAAIQAMQSHQQAEKAIGVPANEILRMPKDAGDTEGWNRFNERVGVPKEAKEYDFSDVKVGDKPLDPKIVEKLGPALQQAHVSKNHAAVVAKAVADALAVDTTAAAQAAEEALNAEREALRISWGAAATSNTLIARNTANSLGIDPKAVDALEKQIGYSKVMEMFLKIGQKTGEDKLISSGSQNQGGFMSADQAQATLDEKMADKAWQQKFSEGDTQALKEFNNLTTLIAQAKRA